MQYDGEVSHKQNARHTLNHFTGTEYTQSEKFSQEDVVANNNSGRRGHNLKVCTQIEWLLKVQKPSVKTFSKSLRKRRTKLGTLYYEQCYIEDKL